MCFVVAGVDIVSNLSCVSSNMSVFEKDDLPRRLHYMANSRIEAVILKMKDAWQADRYHIDVNFRYLFLFGV